MNWKRSIVVTISIIVFALGVKLVIACADEGSPFDNSVGFFQNNISALPQYKPFYFTDYSTFYDDYDWYELPEDDVLPDGNIEEWYSYCKKAATRADIDSFLNKFSVDDVKGLAENASALSAKVKANSFSKFLVLEKNRELLDYMLFAKKCEPLNVAVESYWDDATSSYRTPEKNTSAVLPLIQEGGIKFIRTKNDFLQWRYAYQVMRLSLYSHNYETTLQLYEKMVGNKTAKNIMYPRCLGLKAGALYHTHKKKEAAYLYTKVFDLSDDMKRCAYRSFLWSTDEIKTADIQPLCKNKHEKAVLLVIDGLYEKGDEEFEGLKLMQNAYALDPNIKGLSIIMTREINKAEQRYLQKREVMERSLEDRSDLNALYTMYSESEKKEWKQKKSKYLDYIAQLNQFAQQIASNSKTTDKAFWQLASSYIYFMGDNFTDCKKYVDLAGTQKMNPHERDVHDVINMLCIVNKNERITAETEAELLPCLKWVESREDNSLRFSKVYRDFLTTILTDKYMAQKDITRAVYCLARVNKDKNGGFSVSEDFVDISGDLVEHMSIDRLHEVQAFVEKKDKSDFEKWLTLKTPYPVTVLKELEGTKYIREMKFEQAVAALGSVPKDILAHTVLPDVLISHLQDSQDWNRSDSLSTYNKLGFATKMVELGKALEADPKNGRVAYQYANGLYNMSYYGRAHHAYDYYRSTYDGYAYYAAAARNKLPEYRNEYYGLAVALKYYMVAFNNSSDNETKARCLFMAAKCWQKNCPVKGEIDRYSGSGDKQYYLNSLKNPYLGRLLNEYKKTELYTSAYTSCSYFREYVKKSK